MFLLLQLLRGIKVEGIFVILINASLAVKNMVLGHWQSVGGQALDSLFWPDLLLWDPVFYTAIQFLA